MADITQSQPQPLDSDEEDETDGEYGDNSDDCDSGYDWFQIESIKLI